MKFNREIFTLTNGQKIKERTVGFWGLSCEIMGDNMMTQQPSI